MFVIHAADIMHDLEILPADVNNQNPLQGAYVL
jgi:hypothetical protein